MGKPEGKARAKTSSSYFLRCFGIHRKIHSEKPIVDAGKETHKKNKKKTRSRWLSLSTEFRLKNVEITTKQNYETEKHNSIVDDDKQTLFRVISHVTDQKNIATSGYKAVEQDTREKDTKEGRDINPDPLCYLGYKQVNSTTRYEKLDPVKTIGSESKQKELRVRKRSRVGRFDPVIGISIIMITLVIMLIWGRMCAILCTSTWCYFLPRIKEAAASKRKRSSGVDKDEGGSCTGDMDLYSEAYKKKVVLEGFLVRQHRVSL